MNTSIRDYNYIVFQLSWELIERENVFDHQKWNKLPLEVSRGHTSGIINFLCNIFYVLVSFITSESPYLYAASLFTIVNITGIIPALLSTFGELPCPVFYVAVWETKHGMILIFTTRKETRLVRFPWDLKSYLFIFIYSVKVFAHSFMVLRCFY